ncbi:AfsR/SARP family transcriptional regulator [Nonomuraea sp. NN258]|uniref:AfsR/SARP family transcriptional regulator n=1 Tax=Nonomuraea antri TaxID=2730852 RepID=UPI001569293E|nr:AfsR/SARP family transcriptional regulator [Nonomuraea antri]NRQ35168.1 AfsR/SARP family transcriptional regulator [Nonomuraea antri]
MKYEILGEIRVTGAGGRCALRAKKVEDLLVILLAKAGQLLTTDQLVNAIWGDAPPKRANAALYVYISQLRKLLHDPASGDNPIETRPRGYTLRVEPGELDAERFVSLFKHAQELHRTRSYGPAAAAMNSALKLWRGPAFGGVVDSPIVYSYATMLEESRLDCLELLMETELLFGRHREIIGRLSALTNEHALRETFYQYLMTALHRSDRRAEALEIYRLARRRLRDEIGIEPCRSLQELHQRILNDETTVAV